MKVYTYMIPLESRGGSAAAPGDHARGLRAPDLGLCLPRAPDAAGDHAGGDRHRDRLPLQEAEAHPRLGPLERAYHQGVRLLSCASKADEAWLRGAI